MEKEKCKCRTLTKISEDGKRKVVFRIAKHPGGEISIIITTKRLIDWEKREFLRTDIHLSDITFLMLVDIILGLTQTKFTFIKEWFDFEEEKETNEKSNGN